MSKNFNIPDRAPDYTGDIDQPIQRVDLYSINTLLDQGRWLDAYLYFLSRWEMPRSVDAYSHTVKAIQAWDLGNKYLVGIAIKAYVKESQKYVGVKLPDSLPDKVWQSISAGFTRSLIKYLRGISTLMRGARKDWKKHQKEIEAGTWKGLIYDGANGTIGPFHVQMANYRLDAVGAPYRVIHKPGHVAAYVSPVGLEYLAQAYAPLNMDCLAPVYLGKRQLTCSKLLWHGGKHDIFKRKNCTHSAFLYLS